MQSVPLPNGAKLALATTYGSPVTVSAVTNANPAVATATAHGLTDADIVLASAPGWAQLENSVRRVDAPVANTFNFEGLDSTNTTQFPAGGGVGTVKEVTAWTQIPKVPSFETTGGEPKAQTTSYVDYPEDFEFFTGTTPVRVNFTVSYAPDSTHHAALLAASRSGTLQVLRLVLEDGSTLYYPGRLFFNPRPTTTKDNEMVCNAAFALQGEFTRYAAA
ncbi:MAG: phage tail tube protein [Pseudomonadota bacterium]